MDTRYPQRNLAACMLPWTEDFQLDVPTFEEHIQGAIDDGYESIYVMGTAGEGYAFSDALFEQVVDAFAALAVRDGLDPQVGVISISMQQVVDRIRYGYERGIRMFQISLPAWGALDEGEAMTFFKTVCGTFPDCRFLHYNLPRAKRIIAGPEYRRIAEEAPNLVATKNSTSDYGRTADLMHYVPHLQHFFLEGNFAMGCTLGECSLLCSFGVLFPKTTLRFFEAGVKKDIDEVFRITQLFWQVHNELCAHCPREMIDGSYDKTFIRLRMPHFSNRLQPPYMGLNEEEFARCQKVLEDCFAHID
jgi:dihydrodipicolinate synthase/N-acetylneuraminate lyase